MTLGQFRAWINSVPEEFDVTDLVFREVGDLEGDHWYAKDMPIASVGIDEISGETYFMSQESAMKLKEKREEDAED